jgi:F-type H+-transporting ATPase subunit b
VKLNTLANEVAMRGGFILVAFLAIGFLLFSSSQSWAESADNPAEGHSADKDKPHAKDSGEHKKDDVFYGWLDLSIWTIVVFLVLLFVLSKYAWKPMLQGLEQREHSIQSAMEEAKKAKEEAQTLRTQLAADAAKAQDKVREVIDQARRDAEKVSADLLAKAKIEIQGERDRFRRDVDTARDQAVKEIWGQAAHLATLISSKAIRRQLTPDDHRRLVDEAIAELDQTSKQRETVGASV